MFSRTMLRVGATDERRHPSHPSPAENLHAEDKRLKEKIEQASLGCYRLLPEKKLIYPSSPLQADSELLAQQKKRKAKEENGSSLNDKLTLHRFTIPYSLIKCFPTDPKWLPAKLLFQF